LQGEAAGAIPIAIIAAREIPMFARKLQIDVVIAGQSRPCPREWLDRFAMRNFTGSAEFADTLPIGDGLLEAGLLVDPARLAQSFAEWLTRHGMGEGRPVEVKIREIPRGSA
jgi:hypothetical protein